MRPGAQTVEIAWLNVLFGVWLEMMEEPFLIHIFATQRANGDWFAFEHHGRVRVPLFHSSRDAMIARLRGPDEHENIATN